MYIHFIFLSRKISAFGVKNKPAFLVNISLFRNRNQSPWFRCPQNHKSGNLNTKCNKTLSSAVISYLQHSSRYHFSKALHRLLQVLLIVRSPSRKSGSPAQTRSELNAAHQAYCKVYTLTRIKLVAHGGNLIRVGYKFFNIIGFTPLNPHPYPAWPIGIISLICKIDRLSGINFFY